MLSKAQNNQGMKKRKAGQAKQEEKSLGTLAINRSEQSHNFKAKQSEEVQVKTLFQPYENKRSRTSKARRKRLENLRRCKVKST
eukprot:1148812-Pelagomonas_calceolata.AAC.7